jgi:Tol biopolymer transport system component
MAKPARPGSTAHSLARAGLSKDIEKKRIPFSPSDILLLVIMKRCPECRREYDDTMMFCLDDGAELLYGPASRNEAETVSLPRGGEGETAILSNPGFPAEPAVSRRNWLPVVAVVVLLAAGGAGFAIFNYWKKAEQPQRKAVQIEQLTTNGRTVDAAISPDGKFYIYTVDEGGMHSLWVRQRAASRDVEIIAPEEDVYYWGLSFTPDSEYINFVKVQFEKNTNWSLFQMPVLGGTQRKILEDADGGLGYSPDGKQIAYLRAEYPTDQESSLAIANADGSGERILASRKYPESFPARGRIPVWSPDGKTIAAIITEESSPIQAMSIVEVGVDDGAIKPVKTKDWLYVSQIAWLPEKTGIVVLGTAKDSSSFNRQIWSFSYPGGEGQRITADLSDYTSLSLTGDLETLVTVVANGVSNIWVSPFADSERAVQVRSGGSNEEGMFGIEWSKDGRILFNSNAGGKSEVWSMGSDGSGAKQLTQDAGMCQPGAVSPDARYILFACIKDEKINVWRMDANGGNLKQLTTDNAGGAQMDVTPDSQWVIYEGFSGGETYLWKVPIDGGEPVRISNNPTGTPALSPDGKWIACAYRRDKDSTWRYAVVPIDGGEPLKVFDLIGKKSPFRWSADGSSLYYLRDTAPGVTNIWTLPLDDKPTKPLTNFKTELIFNFALSPDGKQFALARGTVTSNVVLLKDFR